MIPLHDRDQSTGGKRPSSCGEMRGREEIAMSALHMVLARGSQARSRLTCRIRLAKHWSHQHGRRGVRICARARPELLCSIRLSAAPSASLAVMLRASMLNSEPIAPPTLSSAAVGRIAPVPSPLATRTSIRVVEGGVTGALASARGREWFVSSKTRPRRRELQDGAAFRREPASAAAVGIPTGRPTVSSRLMNRC